MSSCLKECIATTKAWKGVTALDHHTLPEGVIRSIDSIVGNLSEEDLRNFIDVRGEEQHDLFEFASQVRDRYLGKKLYLRAVVEISNHCRVRCNYCEMSLDNRALERFRLAPEEVLGAGLSARRAEISTLLIQGGEDIQAAKAVVKILPELRRAGLRTILCLGSLDTETYGSLKQAGADAYIIKFETAHAGLHEELTGRPLDQRIRCIDELTNLGYRVGSGLISDLPTPRTDANGIDILVEGILLTQRRQFPMCSVSPFIPEAGTPLGNDTPGDLERALNVISLLRIANPLSYIPSVSALEQRGSGGQARGLEAGANVVTLNCTPERYREAYRIYGKTRFIVTREHVEAVARDADMGIVNAPSIGIETIDSSGQERWFTGRYSQEGDTSLGDSVYGLMTPALCRFVSWAKEHASGRTVLDLGCGDGRVAIPLALSGVKVLAIDNSERALARLELRRLHFGIAKDFLKARLDDVRVATLAKESAGVVLSNLLYYFSDVDVCETLKKAWESLVGGGRIYVSLEICPRLSAEIAGKTTYFRISSQYNYSAEDLASFMEELRPRWCNREETRGVVVTRRLPLPEKVLVGQPDTIGYTRIYAPHELLCSKNGSS